ncbi:JAB domain-containing protein, partial [Klebsiella pneumoniae]
PSAFTEPSQADKLITERLAQVLGMVDVKVLDHLIVGGCDIFSFAEHGLI